LRRSREVTPREPRMMWIASSWPLVVIRPTFAPFLWIRAFVPTVVPCVSTSMFLQKSSNESPRRSAATVIAASMPSAKLGGVEEDLVAVMRPSRSSTTQSVKVPPMSTPTRKRATFLYVLRDEGGMVAYFFVRLRAGAIDCAPMKLTDPLPRWVSWITRTIFWSVGVVLILGATAWYGMARLA